jgi:hypothetical protein
MFLEVEGTTRLKAIDKFLRNTWLEYCLHLSMFTIKGERYESQPDPTPDPFFNTNSKTIALDVESVFQPGINIDYVHDHVSSTELLLKIISDRSGKITGKGKIKLVARNNEIIFKGTKCKKETATKICTVCILEKDRTRASFCDNCVDLHKCGEEIALPIINSPRSGECGYEG